MEWGHVGPTRQGKGFHFYHFVDQATSYQTAIISPSRTTSVQFRLCSRVWFHVGRSPQIVGSWCSHGAKFGGVHAILTEAQCMQQGRVLLMHIGRTHGQKDMVEFLQVMLDKMDSESEIKSYEDLEEALQFATQTKNQWSRHRGYPPEMLVFGKCAHVPGSVVIRSKQSSSFHGNPKTFLMVFVSEKNLQFVNVPDVLFAFVDNSQVLRRAITSRSRPYRGPFERGEHVMIWKKRGEAEGQWIGPMQVLGQEGNNVVWVSMGQKLF